MSDSALRDTARALEAIEVDLTALEEQAAEHEKNDTERFGAVAKGNAMLAEKQEFLENYLIVIHDQMIEGFRRLGADMSKREPKRGRNGH